jgi:hypothetical protein
MKENLTPARRDSAHASNQRFEIPAYSIRHLDVPHKKGAKNMFAYVDVQNLPVIPDQFRGINPRDPKLTSLVSKKILRSLYDYPELFGVKNRGICFTCDNCYFDSEKKVLVMEFSDPNQHGLLDGGHTYDLIIRELNMLAEQGLEPYVKIETISGFSIEEALQIVEARNTSTQVQDRSLMNLQGYFEKLKTHLKNTSFYKDIAFSEYEVENGVVKSISIMDIIAILTCFNKDLYGETNHPVVAYSGKKACLMKFKEDQEDAHTYDKIFGVAVELLQLHDHIYELYPKLHDEWKKRLGEKKGVANKMTGVGSNDYLQFIGKKLKYRFPEPYVLPILAAFRVFLIEHNGSYHWAKGIKPLELLTGDLGVTLVGSVSSKALEYRNPNKVGKDASTWDNCYTKAEKYYLQHQLNSR